MIVLRVLTAGLSLIVLFGWDLVTISIETNISQYRYTVEEDIYQKSLIDNDMNTCVSIKGDKYYQVFAIQNKNPSICLNHKDEFNFFQSRRYQCLIWYGETILDRGECDIIKNNISDPNAYGDCLEKINISIQKDKAKGMTDKEIVSQAIEAKDIDLCLWSSREDYVSDCELEFAKNWVLVDCNKIHRFMPIRECYTYFGYTSTNLVMADDDDKDWLYNNLEKRIWWTDPNLVDTDGDGIWDREDVQIPKYAPDGSLIQDEKPEIDDTYILNNTWQGLTNDTLIEFQKRLILENIMKSR